MIEIAQTALAGVGCGFNLWALLSVARDLAWTRTHRINGARQFLVATRVRQELLRLLVQGVLLLTGLATLVLPPPGWTPDHFYAELEPQGMLRTAALVSTTIILAAASVLDRWDRETLESFTWDGQERRTDPPCPD